MTFWKYSAFVGIGEIKNVDLFRILVRSSEGKKLFGRSRRRWDNRSNIKIGHTNTQYGVRTGYISLRIGTYAEP
jgi:hypothetical protein